MDNLKTCKNSETWFIIFSDTLQRKHKCICGHSVKRITFVYHQETKAIIMIGTTCLKKYNVHQHLKNRILLITLKECISNQKYRINEENENNIHIDGFPEILKQSIMNEFREYEEIIKTKVLGNLEIDYYDVVLPFRRLLNDVCYLVTEYHYDFMDLLKEIENCVEHMNRSVKHIMIDEKDSDSEQGMEDCQVGPVEYQDISSGSQDLSCYFDISINYIEDVSEVYSTCGIQEIYICNYCDDYYYTYGEKEAHEHRCIENRDLIDEEIYYDTIDENSFLVDLSSTDIEEEVVLKEVVDVIEEIVDVLDLEEEKEKEKEQETKDMCIQTEPIEYKNVFDKYSNATEEELKCSFCVAELDTYCFCDMRRITRRLVVGLLELREESAVTSAKAKELSDKINEMKYKYLYS
jgi:hypothetical protein